MIIENKISLKQRRNFTELFNTVFILIRANFKVIAGALLMVCGPFVLLTAVVSSILQATVMREIKSFSEAIFRSNASQYLSDAITKYAVWFAVIWFFSILTFSFLRAAMINFFLIYESRNEGEEITSSEIASKSFKDGFRLFGGVILLSLISVLPLGLIFGLIALFASAGGAGATALIIILFILLFLAFGPQLVYIFNFSTWFSMLKKRAGLFSAIGDSFKNIKGNFWWVWVIMVCMFFIVSILNYITALPATIYSQVSIFTRAGVEDMGVSYIYILLLIIAQFGANLFHCLGDMIVYLSYYSFEEERTGEGLQKKIDDIGNN